MPYFMKISVVAIIGLALSILGGIVVNGSPNAVSVHVSGLSRDGVGLSLVSTDTTAPPPALEGPPTVLLSNQTQKTIVAYSLLWKTLDSNGNVLLSQRYFAQVRGILTLEEGHSAWEDKPAIPAQESRLIHVGADAEMMPADTYAESLREVSTALGEASQLVISLENVIFRDGTYAGQRNSEFIRIFQAEIDSRKLAMEELVRCHDENRPSSSARETLSARLSSERPDDGHLGAASSNALEHLLSLYDSRSSDELRHGYIGHLRSQLQQPWFKLREANGQ